MQSVKGFRGILGWLSALPLSTLLALAGCGGGTSSATIQSIQVTPASPSVALGTTVQLVATGTFSDGTTQNVSADVTWASSATTVGSVNGTGLVQALAVGTSSLTATCSVANICGTARGSTTLTVSAAVLESISVTPAAPNVAKGMTQAFTAMGLFSDGTKQDLTATATWASDNTAVATIAGTGVASALSVGTTHITAAFGTVVSTAVPLNVTAATLVSIGVTPAMPSIALGTTSQFTATGTFSDSSTQDLTNTVTWSSGTSAVATISNATPFGLATSLTVGTSTITATFGSVQGSVTLTVTPAVLVSIQVTPVAPSIALGLTQQFAATGVYSDNSHQDLTSTVTWASDALSVATISNAGGSNGLATSVGLGAANITATSGLIVSPHAVLTVTAAALTSIVVTPNAPSVAKGLTQQFVATAHYTNNTTAVITNTVSWHSSDTTVATISSANPNFGLATSLTTGTTLISATLGGVTSNSPTLTVTPATLVSIAVTPGTPSVPKGETQQFTATGTYTDATTQILTTQVTWASSATGKATISNANPTQGLATGVAIGSSNISATLGGVTSPNAALTVTAAVLTSIQVTPATMSIATAATRQFTATGTYSDATTQNITTSATLTWHSDNGTFVTVSNSPPNNGVATGGTAGGTAHVTATSTAGGGITSNQATVTTRTYLGYAYVTNSTLQTVSQYEFLAAGALASNTPATAPTGNDPSSVTVDPTGKYAYISNYLDGTVSQYSIDATNGTLTQLLPDVSTGTGTTQPFSVNVDPSGQYAYVANYGTGDVAQFTIGTDGRLTPMTPATVSSGANPQYVTVDPVGPYVYVANGGDGTVSQFKIGAGGQLSAITTAVGVDVQPWSVAVDPSGKYVYVANLNPGTPPSTISQFTINSDGSLSAMTPATVTAGARARFVTVDPTGRYVYVANADDWTISQYSIGAGGALQPLTPATVGTGAVPWGLTVDASGQYLYTADNSGETASQFTINPDGTLTPMTPASIPATGDPTSVVTMEPQ